MKISSRFHLCAFCIFILVLSPSLRSFSVEVVSMAGDIQQAPVWVSGEDGYNTYRIPSIITTKEGTLLAFCEGRKGGRGDSGNIDLLIKRSEDGGETWSPQHVVWDDAGNTCGNPCPVIDAKSGAIFLLMTWNRGDDREPQIIAQESKDTRRVFLTKSVDDGKSWSKPEEITDAAKQPDWTWYATGPGAGIQLERGEHAGRLLVPCDHIEAQTKHYYSHVIYSDDNGETWHLGGSTPKHQVNECEVVELSDGRLMLNMRNYDRSVRARQVAYSRDGGLSWYDQGPVEELIEPICQASIRRHHWGTEGKPGIILFSNPASTDGRVNMTLRASYDDGQSWPFSRTLWSGPSAYSCLTVRKDGAIACLYERGEGHPYETITLAIIPAEIVKK
jgi:sialidase-1